MAEVTLWWLNLNNVGDAPLNRFLMPRLFPGIPTHRPAARYWIMGIGTILDLFPRFEAPYLVWGSGSHVARPAPAGTVVFGCRGRWTCQNKGWSEQYAIADGALLLSDYLKRDRQADCGQAMIRRHDYTGALPNQHHFTTRCAPDGFVAWMQRLWRYRRVSTDSLHAAILADVYGIAWRPLTWWGKWQDHFAQLGEAHRPKEYTLTDRTLLQRRTKQLRSAVQELRQWLTRAEWQAGRGTGQAGN